MGSARSPSANSSVGTVNNALVDARRGRIILETDALLLFGLLAFVGLAFFAERSLGMGDPLRFGPFAAIAFSSAPAAIWLTYFYRQDRHEPEPKHYVAAMFIAGALVAAPVAAFVVENARQSSALTNPTLSPFEPRNLVVTLMVVGVAQELAKYAVLRFTIYTNREFDEPVDGIVYASAVGIGFASFESVEFLRGADGDMLISVAAARTVVTALAHACFAGVTGYALARAKFRALTPNTRALTLIGGLAIASILNGSFRLLATTVETTGLTRTPWRPVVATAGFAVVIFFLISVLMRRMNARSPHAPSRSPEHSTSANPADVNPNDTDAKSTS